VVLTNTDERVLPGREMGDLPGCLTELQQRSVSRYMPALRAEWQMVSDWQDSVKMHKNPSVKLSKFEGTYHHEIYGNAYLKSMGDYLLLTLEHHPDLSARLEHISGDRFLCTYSHPLWGIKVFPFVVEDGKVRSFTLSVADFLEYTTYQFIKQ
jgi:hypothetical protein